MIKRYLAKILAKDRQGLQVISACCAGAKVKITDINIVNIVSDFNTNFKIKREILYELIRTKYNIVSDY